jgi:hypothetical protein
VEKKSLWNGCRHHHHHHHQQHHQHTNPDPTQQDLCSGFPPPPVRPPESPSHFSGQGQASSRDPDTRKHQRESGIKSHGVSECRNPVSDSITNPRGQEGTEGKGHKNNCLPQKITYSSSSLCPLFHSSTASPYIYPSTYTSPTNLYSPRPSGRSTTGE